MVRQLFAGQLVVQMGFDILLDGADDRFIFIFILFVRPGDRLRLRLQVGLRGEQPLRLPGRTGVQDHGIRLPGAALFRRAYPEKCIADASLLDTFARLPTCYFIEKKAAASGAPVYNYVFSFEFPVGSGRVAWHCSDIPFAFRNTDKVAVCNKPGVSDRLEDQVSSAWVRFARTGDPNGPGLPHWPACKPGSIQTMILDETCRVAENHDQALYAAVMQAVRARPGTGKKPVVHR